MTIQLELVVPAARPPAPELVQYRGLPVTWLPWEPGLVTTLRSNTDMSCEHCGEDTGAQPFSSGTVEEQRRRVPARERGYSFATTPERYQVRVLMAFRCPACGSVDVVAHDDPKFFWSWGGPGALPPGARVKARPVRPRERCALATKRPSRPGAPPVVAQASEETRRAARAQLAADLAAKRGRIASQASRL